jgi:hypothetical protein
VYDPKDFDSPRNGLVEDQVFLKSAYTPAAHLRKTGARFRRSCSRSSYQVGKSLFGSGLETQGNPITCVLHQICDVLDEVPPRGKPDENPRHSDIG